MWQKFVLIGLVWSVNEQNLGTSVKVVQIRMAFFIRLIKKNTQNVVKVLD